MTNQSGNAGQTAVLQTEKMIGRQKHKDLVGRAVADNPGCHVFFFPGDGGMGKTRFLQETGKDVLEMHPHTSREVRWSGVIDLYHPETHSNSGIEQALIKRLDPQNEYFATYQAQRQNFEQQRQAGLMGKELEALRQALTNSFREGYKRLAQANRLVLTFDTLELVQYENDTVQELCEVQTEALSVKNWFLEMIPQFPNTVTIFAGRPHRRLQADFQHQFSQEGCSYQTETIERFTPTEAKNYLAELAKKQAEIGKALEPALFQQVYQAADNGRPIYLSLIADLLSPELGITLSEIFPTQTQMFSPEQMQQMKIEIARRLINLPGLYGPIVRYLAYTRQGLTPNLLRALTDGFWSDREMNDAFAMLRRFTFIKTSPLDKNRLYLHDEVYDLINDYILTGRDQTNDTFIQIRDYYRAQRLELQRQLEQAANLPRKQQEEKREQLLNQLEIVTVRLLHYELQIDPLHGYYRCYNRWVDEAIESRRFGYDMRLRDVLLDFLKMISPENKKADHARRNWLEKRTPMVNIQRDGAILWIRRHLAREDFSRAERVAEKLRHSQEPLFQWDKVDDPFYKAALLVVWGEARIFTGKLDQETVALLQQVETWIGDEGGFVDEVKDEPWRRVRLLGRAELDIGYFYRLQFKLSTAVSHYQNAIALYRQVDILSEMATAVNNLAYAYSLLGSLDEAEALANDAIDIRTRLGRRYDEALSRNTRGEVALAADEPHRARAFSQQALTLLTEAGGAEANRRASGLIHLTLGEAYRRLANLHDLGVYDEEKAVEYFVQGRNYLQNALDLFKQLESSQTLDVFAELGRLYRDWTQLLDHLGNKQEMRERCSQAEHFFEKALQAARQQKATHKEADILQDVGVLHRLTGQTRLAQEMARQAISTIPDQYKPQIGIGFQTVDQPVNPFWEILGKLYLLQAQNAFDAIQPNDSPINGKMEEGLAYVVQAVAAFTQHNTFADSPNPKMGLTKAMIYNQLKGRKASHLRQLLDNMKNVARRYNFTQMNWLFSYLERTLGI